MLRKHASEQSSSYPSTYRKAAVMTSRSTTQILTSATAQYGASPSVANDAGPEPAGLPVYDPGATVLTVGAGKQFATISAAVAAAHDGTVILVDSGTYTNDFATIYSKISIIGVGGMVNLAATIPPPNSKGIFTVDNDVTIRNFSFSGVVISDSNGGNGAGIRYEGGAMVLRNCAFIGNQNGVMGSAVIPSLTTNTITIDHSLFDGNGSGTGYTHNLYIGTGVSKLTFTNNISQNANVGHELKSRAVVNDIEGNVFRDGPSGTASYDIDLPNGGQAIIANNIIEKGPNAENNAMIHFGGEGIPYAGSSLAVTHNTFINDKGASTVAVYNQTVMSATITGNSLENITSANIALGPASISGNADASGALISDSTLTGVLPGSTLVITDTLAHQVTLDGLPYLAVQGGGGLLTANAVAGHIAVIGGTGGLNYQETGSSGGNQLTTAAGSVNAIQLTGVGGDTLDSHGTDSILVGDGNLIATISGGAIIADGSGNNKFTVNGTAVITGHGGNPIVGVGAQGNATITGTVGYLQVTNNGGSARFDITQNGAHQSMSIDGGSVDVRVYGGQTNVNTAGGTAGTTLRIGAGPAVVASLGRDTIYAGSGNNTVIVSDAATVYAGTGDLSVFGRSNYAGAKVYGAGGTVTLDGDTGNITYYGGALANTVFSKLNRDTLIGGTGHMTVIGGSGETIIGGSGGLDFFSPDGGGANAISTAAGSVNTLRLAGSATVESWGTDTIFGGTDNSIFNLHGNAILNGSSGNGTITISGDATIYGAGQDWVEVTQGARATIYTGVLETVNETNAWVRLISGQASVTVSGGKATVSSGAYLPISVSTSGDGPVSISASVGMAEIMSRGADLIHGGSGGAKIQARGANAQIWGEEGHLWVTGGTNDTITGGSGDAVEPLWGCQIFSLQWR